MKKLQADLRDANGAAERAEREKKELLRKYEDAIQARENSEKQQKVLQSRADSAEEKRRVSRELGKAVAKLHSGGMVHGDLTTSNAVRRDVARRPVALIDFGLAFGTTSVEDFAVDLYVLERAFVSTHPGSEPLFAELLASYSDGMHAKADVVRAAFAEVRTRGRKRVAFG